MKTVTEKIEMLKQAKEKDDPEAIKAGIGDLSQELQKIGAAMYNKKDDNRGESGEGTEEQH